MGLEGEEGEDGLAGVDGVPLVSVRREVTYTHFVNSMWKKITSE